MIIISAHTDMVKDFSLHYKKGILSGLLDDFAGIVCILNAILTDKELVKMEKNGELKVYFNDGEEWGVLNNAPKVKKTDIIINVDIDNYREISGLINISGFNAIEICQLAKHLKIEGFNFSMKKYCGDEEDIDDSFSWIGKCKVISLTMPTKGNFHNKSFMDIETLKENSRFLKRIICHLL